MSKQEIHNETIAVIGLGFVGLPLAMLLISKGMRVIGVDLDKRKSRHCGKEPAIFRI